MTKSGSQYKAQMAWYKRKRHTRMGQRQLCQSSDKDRDLLVNAQSVPAWTEFAHLVFLLQPTSACVERSLSILEYIMSDQQVNSLSDKIEAALMLRYDRGI